MYYTLKRIKNGSERYRDVETVSKPKYFVHINIARPRKTAQWESACLAFMEWKDQGKTNENRALMV